MAIKRLVRAKVLAAAERPEQARAVLAAALARLCARAETIDEPALRESFVGRVAENVEILALADAWQVR